MEETAFRVADFFSFHVELLESDNTMTESRIRAAEEILENWTSLDHALYIIAFEERRVGFVHIGYRGENVAWIEDIYVDSAFRGRGIASQAIKLAEELIAQNKTYTAVCMDVSPRNSDALKLYHRLGYTNLNLITVRKEFGDNKRDKKVNFLGSEFNY